MRAFTTVVYKHVPSTTSDNIIIYATLPVSIAGFFVGMMMGIHPFYVVMGVLVFAFLVGVYLKERHKLETPPIGTLHLCRDTIRVHEETFRLKDVKDLKILFSSYKGEVSYSSGSCTVHDGEENEIGFTMGERNIVCRFLIKSEAHMEELSKMMETWYYNKVMFDERRKDSFFSSRSICFYYPGSKKREEFMEKYRIQSLKPLVYKN